MTQILKCVKINKLYYLTMFIILCTVVLIGIITISEWVKTPVLANIKPLLTYISGAVLVLIELKMIFDMRTKIDLTQDSSANDMRTKIDLTQDSSANDTNVNEPESENIYSNYIKIDIDPWYIRWFK